MVTWWRYWKVKNEPHGETAAQRALREQARDGYLQAMNLLNTNLGGATRAETMNAWQSKAIMSDDIVRRALLELIENDDRFNAVSDQVLWREATYMRQKWLNFDERQIATSFAYYHNAGTRSANPPTSLDTQAGQYVTSFLGHWDKSCIYSISASRLSLNPVKQQPEEPASEEQSVAGGNSNENP